MTCRCGVVKANQALIRKYHPKFPVDFKALRERDRLDTITLAKDKIARGESVKFWQSILDRKQGNE